MAIEDLPQDVRDWLQQYDELVSHWEKVAAEAPEGVDVDRLGIVNAPRQWSPSTGDCGYINYNEFPFQY